LNTGEVVSSQEHNLQGKQINVFGGFLPPLNRKKYTQILCAKENQIFFFLCLEITAVYTKV